MELSEPQDWMQHQSVIAAGELPLFLPQILVEWMDYPKHQSVMEDGELGSFVIEWFGAVYRFRVLL